MLPNRLLQERDQNGLLLTSVTALSDGSLLASAATGGIYRIQSDGQWLREDGDLPEGARVNRMEAVEGTAYACTTKGLFTFENGRWLPYTMYSIPLR